MVSLIAVTEWLINRRISTQLEQQTAQQLDTSDSIFQKFEQMRAQELITQYRSLNNEPRYKALLQAEAQTLSAAGDLKTTTDFLEARVKEYGASVATCTFLTENSQRFAVSIRTPART